MRIVYERAVGLDVHLKTIQACLDAPSEDLTAARVQTHRQFKTFTDTLGQLADWVTAERAQVVAMESTAMYWLPVWQMLERRCPQVKLVLVNPHQVQQVPGRKTDTTDSAWIAELAAYGLLRGSLVPALPIRQLRHLTRYRHKLIKQRGSEAQRVLMQLESAGIKLGIVVSDIMGVSAQRMLAALIAGERDVEVLADMALGKLRAKIPDLRRATVGNFTDRHAAMLQVILDHIDSLDVLINRLSDQIRPLMAPFDEQAAHLMTVPGFGPRVIETLIAQTTGDMSHFPDEHHLASWACICPGNRESAGKRKSGRTRKGNPELRYVLTEAGWAAGRTSTYHGALLRHLTRTLGNNPVGRKKAALGVGHSLLCASWHIMKYNVDYQDLGADYFANRKDPEKEAARLINKLQKLTGKKVILAPAA
jgi:transposase